MIYADIWKWTSIVYLLSISRLFIRKLKLDRDDFYYKIMRYVFDGAMSKN